MSVFTIIGSGMMGLVLAFPARENGNTVYLVGHRWIRKLLIPLPEPDSTRNLTARSPTAWNTFNSLKYQRFCRIAI